MKKILVFLLVFSLFAGVTATAYAADKSNKKQKDIIISNGLFSISLPYNTKGTYKIKMNDTQISVYDKTAKKEGFGGFAFGIEAYENPKDHAMMPGGRKLGELVDKEGTTYDIVLNQPTDIQYNYIKGESDSYKHLYTAADDTVIKGVKKGKYYAERGMKGEDLYGDVLEKHVLAIKEKWDSEKLENENMSYMYNVLRSSGEDVMEKIGYAYHDVNADGIEELLIGEIADGAWKGVIYDIYTMVDRKPEHVISGGSRDRYFVCNNVFLCNEYSSGADESGWRVYSLVENSTELFPQVAFKYDGYRNKAKPWYISYEKVNNKDKWENVTEKVFNERKKVFETYERFNFTPLEDL